MLCSILAVFCEYTTCRTGRHVRSSSRTAVVAAHCCMQVPLLLAYNVPRWSAYAHHVAAEEVKVDGLVILLDLAGRLAMCQRARKFRDGAHCIFAHRLSFRLADACIGDIRSEFVSLLDADAEQEQNSLLGETDCFGLDASQMTGGMWAYMGLMLKRTCRVPGRMRCRVSRSVW